MSWVTVDLEREQQHKQQRIQNSFSQCLTVVSDSPAINGIWTKDFEQHDIRFYHHERLGQWALDIRFPSHFFNSDRGARAFV
ncbi:MAG: hypothetical protein K0U52_10845, partial [Gammaproteobacteria bacterium]|nr:hypothetical protein [Gammaproteobacteria bacterium]